MLQNNLNSELRQDVISHDHQTRYNANHSRRYTTRARNVGSDTEMPVPTTFLRRRPVNVVTNCDYKKRQLPVVEDGVLVSTSCYLKCHSVVLVFCLSLGLYYFHLRL